MYVYMYICVYIYIYMYIYIYVYIYTFTFIHPYQIYPTFLKTAEDPLDPVFCHHLDPYLHCDHSNKVYGSNNSLCFYYCRIYLVQIYIYVYTYTYAHIYVYIYIYVYVYMYMCIYIHVYIYIYRNIHTHIYIYTYIYTYMYIHAYMYVYVCECMCACVCVWERERACVCECVCVYVHIYTYENPQIHTQTDGLYVHIQNVHMFNIFPSRIELLLSKTDSGYPRQEGKGEKNSGNMLFLFLWGRNPDLVTYLVPGNCPKLESTYLSEYPLVENRKHWS